jgi:glycosyltransferase involved in cell wall biosynthesis
MIWIPEFKQLIPNTIFIVFCSFVLIQFLYVFFIHRKFAFYQETPVSTDLKMPPVSIIIAARNESDNLYENLPSILCQNYPEFEVIVVNNQSIDDSSWLLTAFCQQFPNLRVVELGRNKHLRPGKKLPITLAIKAAKYEHFVLTDADCKPTSSNWLRLIASKFNDQKQIVIGYAPFTKSKGIINKIIRFDTAWIGVSYLSMAMAKLPYMGVGRNMAYTKSVFNSVNGFKSHYSIPSGDDDLFIQEAAKKNNYTIQIDADSHCYSPASTSWSRWVYQKSRHYSTSSRYKKFKKFLLGIYPLTLILMWTSVIPLFFFKEMIFISSCIFLSIILFKWWIQGRCLNQLKEHKFARFFPFWDLFYALLIPILYYISERKKYYKW